MVLQATLGNSLSFDFLSCCQNGCPTSKIDIDRSEVIDTLVIAMVVVVLDKGGDLGLEIAR